MEVSVQVTGAWSPEALLASAAGAERAQVDRLWIAENPYEQAGAVMCAAIAARHPDLNLGIGIVSARSRHPVIIAQDYLAVANFSRRKFILGLGVGYESERLALGLPKRSGLEILRETIGVLRKFTAGESVPSWTSGESTAISLRFPTRRVPIYVGAIGPKTLQLTGHLADGVLFSKHSSMDYLREAVAVTLAARSEVGAAEGFGRSVYVVYGGNADRAEVSRRVKPGLARFARGLRGRPATQALLKGLKMTSEQLDDLAARLEAGASPDEGISDAMVDDLVIWGDPSRCVVRLAEYRAAGLTDVGLGLGSWLPDLDQALREVGEITAAWRAAW